MAKLQAPGWSPLLPRRTCLWDGALIQSRPPDIFSDSKGRATVSLRRSFALTILLFLQISIVASARELTAGVARVEITPPIGFPMGGYAARSGPSTGVHDPLYATALVLKTDELTVAIISCDLLSFPSERVVSLARD